MAPDLFLGALALVIVVVYAAWHEYASKNHRDAKLLAGVGAIGLIGSTVILLQ